MYDEDTTQMTVYDEVGAPLLDKAFAGFNGTIFAYGQTGSGKTHTMVGPPGSKATGDENDGILPRIVNDIFTAIDASSDSLEFMAKVSYIEVYLEKIRDLLDPSKHNVRIREDRRKGVWLEDVTERYASNRVS